MTLIIFELLWWKQLLRAFGIDVPSCKVFCDNTSSINMTNNPINHKRAKHIDVDCQFIREPVVVDFMKMIHIPLKHQLDDPLTKALPRDLFHRLITQLKFCNIYTI